MKTAGQIALIRLPQTDMTAGKPRPVLMLAALPGRHDDWLVCMISTQMHQVLNGFDETVTTDAEDFRQSGLKTESAIRVARLAVLSGDLLEGAIGRISAERLQRIKSRLSEWIAR